MRILHLCLGNFYIDNFSYQENLLPKYHKKQGNSVEIVASLETFNEDGQPARLDSPSSYLNEHGIRVTRLRYRSLPLSRRLRVFHGLGEKIRQFAPDVLFVHNVQFLDGLVVRDYLRKNSGVRLYIDNHADHSNSARSFLSRWILHGIIWKCVARLIEPHTTKFYGVLPARVDFLTDVYGLSRDHVELLVMGADDEEVAASLEPSVRTATRLALGVGTDEFLLVTGGKIDAAKRQVLNLMRLVGEMFNPRVKLIVFGSVVPELKEEVAKLSSNGRVQYVGWANSAESYRYFAAADLVVFPGRHSVYWEQACGMGKPLVVKHWRGTTHIDLGGNCRFLESDDIDELRMVLDDIVGDQEGYERLLDAARTKGKQHFSYADIAARSIT